jgi:hypothetical protein
MRIAYLLPDPGIPVGGIKGASVHVGEITRAFARAGHDVLLVAMRAAGLAPDGVELVVLDPGSLGRGPGSDAGRIAAVERVLADAEPAIRAFGPDLLVERLSLFAGGGTDLARRLGVPRLVEINAPVTAERAGYQGTADVVAGEMAHMPWPSRRHSPGGRDPAGSHRSPSCRTASTSSGSRRTRTGRPMSAVAWVSRAPRWSGSPAA